jgi:hypothetical protein
LQQGGAPGVVATRSDAGAAALLGLVMGVLVVTTAGRPLDGLPIFGALIVTTRGLPVLAGLAEQMDLTLLVLPAVFIVLPGERLRPRQSVSS